jgi:hypothetical protein
LEAVAYTAIVRDYVRNCGGGGGGGSSDVGGGGSSGPGGGSGSSGSDEPPPKKQASAGAMGKKKIPDNVFKTNSDNKLKQPGIGTFFGKSSGKSSGS